MDSLFIVAPIFCFVLVLVFVMQYLVSFSYFAIMSLVKRELIAVLKLYFCSRATRLQKHNLSPATSYYLLLSCAYSPWCHGLVCGL